MKTHVDLMDVNTVVISDGIRGNPNKNVINEPDLYPLTSQRVLHQPPGGNAQ